MSVEIRMAGRTNRMSGAVYPGPISGESGGHQRSDRPTKKMIGGTMADNTAMSTLSPASGQCRWLTGMIANRTVRPTAGRTIEMYP